jgi:hypothetical protein
MTSHISEERSILQDNIPDSLSLQQDGVESSLHQVYERVDQRIAKVEAMLKAQADQVHTGQSAQLGPLYRPRPMS